MQEGMQVLCQGRLSEQIGQVRYFALTLGGNAGAPNCQGYLFSCQLHFIGAI
jgi:hypothetical protein